MKIKYAAFLQHYFQVLDRERQIPVPFVLNPVQQKYIQILEDKYTDMEGVREIILKARQQGFSTLILALFTVDFLLRPYSVSICISHRKDATELLFKKVKFFIDSYLRKLAAERVDPKLQGHDQEVAIDKLYQIYAKELFKNDNKGMIENGTNNAMFYIGTAGTKVGGRGGSARNVHFSEGAFYQDTDLITAQEIVVSTAQQVPQGKGMIFIESTANGEGNFYQQEWERATEHQSAYRPQFFGWQEFYSKEWVEEKKKEFPSEKMWKQEYPGDPDEAFISSGSPYFDPEVLDMMLKARVPAIQWGKIFPNGEF